jgi:hypothetical protein
MMSVTLTIPDKHCLSFTGKPPLFFQHQGHSRTIVGVERRSTLDGAKVWLVKLAHLCSVVPCLVRLVWARVRPGSPFCVPRQEYNLLVLDPASSTAKTASELRKGIETKVATVD